MRFLIAGLSVCVLCAAPAGAQERAAELREAAFNLWVVEAEGFAKQERGLLTRETAALVKLGAQAHSLGAKVAGVYAQWVAALRPTAEAGAVLDAVARARGRRPLGPDNVAAWESLWGRFSTTWATQWMGLSESAANHGHGNLARRWARRALGRQQDHPGAQGLLRGQGVAALAPGPPAPVTEGDWEKAWEARWGPFAVKSDAAPNRVRRAVSWLERSLAWTREHCGGSFSCEFDKPVQVFVFGSRAAFTAEMQQWHKNRAANAADLWGFYSGRDRALHALLPDHDDEGLRLVMQHEGVHAFLALGTKGARHEIRKPGALAMEAIAVWAEQFTLAHDRWTSDRDAAGRLAVLRTMLATGERPTLESLLAKTEYMMRRDRAVELYAWAAAIAWFFCEHPDPARSIRMREAFLEFLRRWYTEPVDPAVLAALTKRTWPALEREWRAMLDDLSK